MNKNNQKDEIRICLTGGATGGHFFPLLFVGRELKKIFERENLPFQIFYLGGQPLKKELLENEGFKVINLPQFKLRRYFSFKNFIDILKFPFNFFLAFYHLFRLLPNVIFSKGGPGSLGVVLAGWILRIPIIIHDSDVVPGLTNRISSIFAKKIAVAFKESEHYFKKGKIVVVGQPIDNYSLELPVLNDDYQRFGLNKEKPIILVLGGSQGSKFLNELIAESSPQILNFAQLVHQTGEKYYQETYLYVRGILSEKNPSQMQNYHPFHFIPHEDIIVLMKLSDLIIARAGSGTIFEIASLGKPSILIPIDKKIAGNHQIMNAAAYANFGACKVLEEKNAKPHLLISLIKEILFDSSLYESMHNSALIFSKPKATLDLVQEILNLLNLK